MKAHQMRMKIKKRHFTGNAFNTNVEIKSICRVFFGIFFLLTKQKNTKRESRLDAESTRRS